MTRRARPAKSRRPQGETAPAGPRLPGGAGAVTAVPAPPVAAAPPAILWRWLVPLACALVTFAVFWPVLGNQFVDWDDDINFVNNLEFRGLGRANLRFMLTTTMMGHWIPATWITFGADYLLWGMNQARQVSGGDRAVPEGGRLAPGRRGRSQQPGGRSAPARRRRARHRPVRARAAHRPRPRAGAAKPRRGPAAPVTGDGGGHDLEYER